MYMRTYIYTHLCRKVCIHNYAQAHALMHAHCAMQNFIIITYMSVANVPMHTLNILTDFMIEMPAFFHSLYA